jgi:hypothetical protein
MTRRAQFRFNLSAVTRFPIGPVENGNMERAEARHDLIARLRSRRFGTVRKLAERLQKRVPVNPRLPRPEILRRPREDVREIELSDCAEANTPSSLDHVTSFARV